MGWMLHIRASHNAFRPDGNIATGGASQANPRDGADSPAKNNSGQDQDESGKR